MKHFSFYPNLVLRQTTLKKERKSNTSDEIRKFLVFLANISARFHHQIIQIEIKTITMIILELLTYSIFMTNAYYY